MNDLLISGLRDSAQNHVELTRKLSPEIQNAARHYYALICAEYCRVAEILEKQELNNE